MKIEIERSGGIAGTIKIVKIDTEILPSKIARDIERYFSKPNQTSILIARKNKAPDSFVYKIATQSGNKKEEIEFAECDADKNLKMAINYVFKNFTSSFG